MVIRKMEFFAERCSLVIQSCSEGLSFNKTAEWLLSEGNANLTDMIQFLLNPR